MCLFAFDYSAKKLQAFFDELDADATTKENMGKKDKIMDPLWNAMDKSSGRIVYL